MTGTYNPACWMKRSLLSYILITDKIHIFDKYSSLARYFDTKLSEIQIVKKSQPFLSKSQPMATLE